MVEWWRVGVLEESWSAGLLKMAYARGANHGIWHRPKSCVQVLHSHACVGSACLPTLPYSSVPWDDCDIGSVIPRDPADI